MKKMNVLCKTAIALLFSLMGLSVAAQDMTPQQIADKKAEITKLAEKYTIKVSFEEQQTWIMKMDKSNDTICANLCEREAVTSSLEDIEKKFTYLRKMHDSMGSVTVVSKESADIVQDGARVLWISSEDGSKEPVSLGDIDINDIKSMDVTPESVTVTFKDADREPLVLARSGGQPATAVSMGRGTAIQGKVQSVSTTAADGTNVEFDLGNIPADEIQSIDVSSDKMTVTFKESGRPPLVLPRPEVKAIEE